MDNSNNTPITNRGDRSNIWICPELREQFKKLNTCHDIEQSNLSVDIIDEFITVTDSGKAFLKLSFNKNNLHYIEKILINKTQPRNNPKTFEDENVLPLFETLISYPHPSSSTNLKSFWNSLLNSFSLQATLESYLKCVETHGFNKVICLVHPKGETSAWQLTPPSFSSEMKPISINDFNSLFQSLKKTKNKHFSSSDSKWSWLPINGVFIADTFSYKKFNVIWINSREEFLPLTDIDHKKFFIFSQIIKVWLERLVELEFSDIKSSNIIWLIEHLPFEICIKDSLDRIVFVNTHFSDEDKNQLKWIALPRGFKIGYVLDSGDNEFEIDAFQKQKVLLLGDLFNTLRHELSNPLFGLRLSAELLLNSIDNEEFTLIFSQVLSNIQRSQSIIHNLSKLYSEEQATTTTDLLPILKESITLAKSELKGIILNTSSINFSDSIEVSAKPVAIAQILFNLLVNSAHALKVSTPKPTISISLIRNGDDVSLSITDNGPGLPLNIKENLFKPFHTTKSKGHGLGLALSKDLAIKMGGDLVHIPTESGTCFSLNLKKSI